MISLHELVFDSGTIELGVEIYPVHWLDIGDSPRTAASVPPPRHKPSYSND